MNNLFNFSPLFFHNLQNFISNREMFQDPSMQAYASGQGFDRRDTGFSSGLVTEASLLKVPRWMANYFKEPVEKHIQVPIRLQGIGVPTGALANAAKAAQGSKSGMAALFHRNQPTTIEDSFGDLGRPQHLTSQDAQKYIELTQNALKFAGTAHSLWDAQDSELKRNGQLMVAGQGSVYEDAEQIPRQYREAAGRYREDLAKIVPFAENDKMYQLINFAHGLAEDGSQRDFLLDRAARQPVWPVANSQTMQLSTEGDRRQMLFDTVSRQISLGQKLPMQNSTMRADDFLGGRAPKQKYYLYEERSRALSRFSLA